MCAQGESLRQKDSRGTPRIACGVSLFASGAAFFMTCFPQRRQAATLPRRMQYVCRGVARVRAFLFQPEN
jgi:hypothetical protein